MISESALVWFPRVTWQRGILHHGPLSHLVAGQLGRTECPWSALAWRRRVPGGPSAAFVSSDGD